MAQDIITGLIVIASLGVTGFRVFRFFLPVKESLKKTCKQNCSNCSMKIELKGVKSIPPGVS